MIEAATGTATGDGYDLHKKKRRKERKTNLCKFFRWCVHIALCVFVVISERKQYLS